MWNRLCAALSCAAFLFYAPLAADQYGPLQSDKGTVVYYAPVFNGWEIFAITDTGRGFEVFVDPKRTYQRAVLITTVYDSPLNLEIQLFEVHAALDALSVARHSGMRDELRLVSYVMRAWSVEPRKYGDKVQWITVTTNGSAQWLIRIYTVAAPPEPVVIRATEGGK